MWQSYFDCFQKLHPSYNFPFIIFFVNFVVLVGGSVLSVFVAFFSLLSLTGSAVLPFPQVPVQEPFLNAHANKRKNVSFRTWQDNEAQRVGRSFAAGTRHPPWGGAKENWSIFNRCKGFWKSPSFLKLYISVDTLYTAVPRGSSLHYISLESSQVGEFNTAETGKHLYKCAICAATLFIILWLI